MLQGLVDFCWMQEPARFAQLKDCNVEQEDHWSAIAVLGDPTADQTCQKDHTGGSIFRSRHHPVLKYCPLPKALIALDNSYSFVPLIFAGMKFPDYYTSGVALQLLVVLFYIANWGIMGIHWVVETACPIVSLRVHLPCYMYSTTLWVERFVST